MKAGFDVSGTVMKPDVRLFSDPSLPQSQALLRSGVAGYGLGRAELVDVLRAEHDLADQRIELLSAEFDQQRQLAAIERLIGGDL